jgi:hypothetical protein
MKPSKERVTWKYKPFLLSLALSTISEKDVFTIGAEIWLAVPTFTFLCCKMNVTCSGSSSRESDRSGGYFPKWNFKPQPPVHKRQSESQEEVTCLQNSLKAMQAEWTSCTRGKSPGIRTGTSRLPSFLMEEGTIRNLGTVNCSGPWAPTTPAAWPVITPSAAAQI